MAGLEMGEGEAGDDAGDDVEEEEAGGLITSGCEVPGTQALQVHGTENRAIIREPRVI